MLKIDSFAQVGEQIDLYKIASLAKEGKQIVVKIGDEYFILNASEVIYMVGAEIAKYYYFLKK